MGPAARLAEALDFAARSYVERHRNWTEDEPHINHLTDVAANLGRSMLGDNTDLIIAGVLYDTIENAVATRAEIAATFGEAVADLVREVTEEADLFEAERQQPQVEHRRLPSNEAQLIDLVVRTSDLTSRMGSASRDWDRDRLLKHMAEGRLPPANQSGEVERPAARLAEAANFAAFLHVDQRRKGDRAEPYFNHLADVTVRLARSGHGEDTDLLVAGMLHDTVEDTDATWAEIATFFGEAVADLVKEVTDDKTLAKAERKRLQVEHVRSASDRAKLIKLADKASNLTSLATSPPAGWNRQRLSEYVDWAEAVIAGCRGIDTVLEQEFTAATSSARQAISARHPRKEDTP